MEYKFLKLFVILLICSMLFGCSQSPPENREIKGFVLKTETIMEQTGTFVIAVGHIATEEKTEKYYYLFVKGQEGFRLNKINSDNLEIVETDDASPYIKGVFYYDGKINKYGDYIVYVPTGTIFVDYDVNINKEEIIK